MAFTFSASTKEVLEQVIREPRFRALTTIPVFAPVSLGLIAVAQDVATTEIITIRPKDTLASAMRRFTVKNLEELRLVNTKVNDLSPLVALKNLKRLSLDLTQVDDDQIDALRQALPNCTIEH